MARTTKRYGNLVSLVLSSLLAVAPAIAVAEDEPAGESAGPARPTTPPPGDVVAPTEAAEAASTPVTLPPLPPPPPPGKPLFDPKIGVGAWLRVGYRIQNPSEVEKLNDVFVSCSPKRGRTTTTTSTRPSGCSTNARRNTARISCRGCCVGAMSGPESENRSPSRNFSALR